jgi:hypothetical protein
MKMFIVQSLEEAFSKTNPLLQGMKCFWIGNMLMSSYS